MDWGSCRTDDRRIPKVPPKACGCRVPGAETEHWRSSSTHWPRFVRGETLMTLLGLPGLGVPEDGMPPLERRGVEWHTSQRMKNQCSVSPTKGGRFEISCGCGGLRPSR